MANEQTSVPLYAAAEILTAANMNISAGTGVPVFATTVTRDAAFGGAGEKVLAEGQLCYLSSTNVVQYYDGAAWATVGPATSGALVRVGGGTLSGASTTFSSVFSATYAAYKVVLTNLLSADHTYFQIGSATASYYSSGAKVTYAGTVSGQGSSNQAQFDRLGYSAGTNYFAAIIEIQNPFLSVETVVQYSFINTNPSDGGGMLSGFLDTTASYTSIKVGASTGTLTGTCNIYGYTLS